MLSLPEFKEKQIVFIYLNEGEKLSFKNDNVIVKDKENTIIHQSTCYRLFALYIVGNITVTSGLLQRSKKFGFSIVFMTCGLRPYGIWGSKTEGNFILREKQYKKTSLTLATHLIKNKIQNQLLLLKKMRNKKEKDHQTIDRLKGFKKRLEKNNIDLYTILGVEGISSREFFKNFYQDCNWQGRRPRVKHDPINSLQDTGYTLLFNFIESLLSLYGFDVYKGVFHQPFYKRKSLVCDIVEPFRPIIDARIKKAYALGQIKEEDFTIVNKQYRIFWKKEQALH